MLECIFLVLDQPIIGARSSCFGAGDLVLEFTVLVPNRMLSSHFDYDFAPNHILPKPNLS